MDLVELTVDLDCGHSMKFELDANMTVEEQFNMRRTMLHLMELHLALCYGDVLKAIELLSRMYRA